MQWTAAQYAKRVIVEVASATGQKVASVLGEPFALTLWTWAEIRQMDREANVERLGERVDLAGMVAIGFNDPKQLRGQQERYTREVRGLARRVLPEVDRAGMMRDLIEAHKRLAPMEA